MRTVPVSTPATIGQTQDPLTRIFRLLFFRRGTAEGDIRTAVRNYARRVGLTDDQKINSIYYNVLKKFCGTSEVSMSMFYRICSEYMNLNIDDITITVSDPVTGEIYQISCNDPVEEPTQDDKNKGSVSP